MKKLYMDGDQEHKSEFSNFLSNYDLILYSLIAAAFIFYGVFSLLTHLWSSGIGYFVVGVLVFSSMSIQVGYDLFHKRIGKVSKIVLSIWVLATTIIIIGDLFSTF